MTMTTHIQTSATNVTEATSVSSLDLSGSSKTKFSKGKSQTKTDIYQVVTDSIIEALEAGVKPWVCPWVRGGQAAGLPANFTTGTAYCGINIMLLWCSAAKQGFNDSRWLTYKQAQELGGQVRKGEHGTTAIFYKTLEKEDADSGEIEKIPMLKGSPSHADRTLKISFFMLCLLLSAVITKACALSLSILSHFLCFLKSFGT